MKIYKNHKQLICTASTNFKKFSFKFKKHSNDLNSLATQPTVLLSTVEDQIKSRMEKYKSNKILHEEKYFIQNCSYYKAKSKEEITLICEMLLKLSMQKIYKEIDNKENFTGKNKLSQFQPKSNHFIYQNFKNVIANYISNIKEMENVLLLFSKILQLVKSNKKTEDNFYFILSDLLSKYLLCNGKNFDFEFLKLNYRILDQLKNLPYMKKEIGSIVDKILSENSKILDTLDKNIYNFLIISSFQFSPENYFKLFIYNANNNEYFKTDYKAIAISTISSFSNFFKIGSENSRYFSNENLMKLDNHLARIIASIYNSKEESKLNIISDLFSKFLFVDYGKKKYFKYFPNLIGESNCILSELNKVKSFRETYINIILFYTAFYTHFKHYEYTDDPNFYTFFSNYHCNLFKSFSHLDESLDIKSKINLFQYAFYNNIFCPELNKYIDLTICKNSIDFLKFKAESKEHYHHFITRVLISFLNLNFTNRTKEKFEYILKIFIDLEGEITQYNSSNYFLNLCTILYNSLINGYDNLSFLEEMVHLLFRLMKSFSFHDEKHLRRVILIIQHLKLFFYKEIYMHRSFNKDLMNLEHIFQKQFTNNSEKINYNNIWWTKENFSYNSLQINEALNTMELVKNKLQTKLINSEIILKFYPSFLNLYSSDFCFTFSKNNSTIEKQIYLEFISPYHLVNYEDVNQFQINNKYIKKKQILNSYGIEVKYVDFNLLKNKEVDKLSNELF